MNEGAGGGLGVMSLPQSLEVGPLAGLDSAWHNPASALLVTFAIIWFLGVLLSLFFYWRSFSMLRRALREAAVIPTHIKPMAARLQKRCRTNVPVVVSQAIKTPCAFGLTRPAVVLPANLIAMPVWQIEAVLTHELLHIRDRDPLWLLLGELVRALHWLNPLAWICVRRHRHFMELKCDSHSIRAGVPLDEYVRAIVSTSRQLFVGSDVAAAMAADGVVARLRQLIDGHKSKPLPTSGRIYIMSASILLALIFGCSALVAVAEPAIGVAPPGFAQRSTAFDPAAVKRVIANETARLGPVTPGNARLYAIVSAGVSLRAPDVGFACSGMGCVTTIPARRQLQLVAAAAHGSVLHWDGCNPSPNRNSCTVDLSSGEHLVTLRGH